MVEHTKLHVINMIVVPKPSDAEALSIPMEPHRISNIVVSSGDDSDAAD